MRMLNLGCGSTFHPDWVNVDFIDHGGKVLAYDLRLGIPFADASFDVVYHSHVLEHLPKAWAEFFLKECYRVLRPGGLLRVVVPDLENITRAYLKSLDAVRSGEEGANTKHQWMIVELIDQLTRTRSGGEMLDWWKQKPVPQESFIIERLGKEAEQGIATYSGQLVAKPKTALPPIDTSFLLSGELHTWMYDACSLAHILEQCNFAEISSKAHDESALPAITKYGLDTTAEGKIRKPDSLFMEAKKPALETAHIANVAMFSFSDEGGAAIAALRLHNALQDTNIQSQMYVARQKFFQNKVYVVPARKIVKDGGITPEGSLAERSMRREVFGYNRKMNDDLRAYPHRPLGSEHFSIPGQCVPFESIPFIEDFDILHFHWVAGLCDPSLSLHYLKGKKIVWTLHDMNAFTGGCHYSNGCRKFESVCAACPELGSEDKNDLAFQTWQARMASYRELDMHIVAPSTWLAEEAKKSALFRKFPVHTIPYAQPLDIFKPLNREYIREQLGIKPNALALLFSSQSLANTRKGAVYLVKLLYVLAQSSLKDKVVVLMLGNNVPPEFESTGIEILSLGHIDETEQVAAVYNAADAVLVPSLEDNQPNVICEALGCGSPVIAFANGGIAEMIRHEETGYLAESKNVDQLLQGIIWADKTGQNPMTRRLCRAQALEHWNSSKGAANYVELYKSILGLDK